MMPKETAKRRAARGLPPFFDAPNISDREDTPPRVGPKSSTLRSSCNECIKLKRACRWGPPSPPGKMPQPSNNGEGEGASAATAATSTAPAPAPAPAPSCLLCTRMDKVCSRSTKKRSGPPKGTKYTRKKDRVPSATTGQQPTRKKRKKQEELQSRSGASSTFRSSKRHVNDTSTSSAAASSVFARKGSEIIASDRKSSLIEQSQLRRVERAKTGEEREKEEEGLAVAGEGPPAEVEDGARLLLHMVSAAATSVARTSDMPEPFEIQEQRLPSLVDLGAVSPSAQRLRGLSGGFFRVSAAAQQHQNLSPSHTGALKRHDLLRLVNPSLLSHEVPATFQHHQRYTPSEVGPAGDVVVSLGPWRTAPTSFIFDRYAHQ